MKPSSAIMTVSAKDSKSMVVSQLSGRIMIFRSVRVHKESNLSFNNLGVNSSFEPVTVPLVPPALSPAPAGEIHETTFGPPAVGDIVLCPVNVGKTEQGLKFEIVNRDVRQDVKHDGGIKNSF